MANKKAKTSKKLNPKGLRLYYVTVPDLKTAKSISKTLLHEKLVACANIIPKIHSYYFWNNKLASSQECVLILKSHKKLHKNISARIIEIHPYDTPCVIELSPESINREYGSWLCESLIG